MKKLLAFLLVLVMILSVSLVACDNKTNNVEEDDDDWGNGNEVADTNKDNNNKEDEKTPSGTTPPTLQWIEKNDKVYVGLDGVNLRTAASITSSSVVATVSVGTELERLETNGTWDKVLYSGQEVYVLCDLVSTIKTNFEAVNYDEADYVTLTIVGTNGINLRSTPFVPGGNYKFENATIQGLTAANGGILKKIGVTASGNWYIVTYSGTVGDTTYENEVLYMAASNVTDGFVTDPSRPSGSVGGIG